jgi:hypothetical protein
MLDDRFKFGVFLSDFIIPCNPAVMVLVGDLTGDDGGMLTGGLEFRLGSRGGGGGASAAAGLGIGVLFGLFMGGTLCDDTSSIHVYSSDIAVSSECFKGM